MKTSTRNTLSLAALTVLFGLAGTQAQAQLNLAYSIGGAPTITASSDTLDIAGYTGSATLVSGVSQSLKIGSATFTATSSNNNIFYNQDISRDLTLNSVTELLPQVAAFQFSNQGKADVRFFVYAALIRQRIGDYFNFSSFASDSSSFFVPTLPRKATSTCVSSLSVVTIITIPLPKIA